MRSRGGHVGCLLWNLLVPLLIPSMLFFHAHGGDGAWLGEEDTVLLLQGVGSEDLNQRLRDFVLELEASQ